MSNFSPVCWSSAFSFFHVQTVVVVEEEEVAAAAVEEEEVVVVEEEEDRVHPPAAPEIIMIGAMTVATIEDMTVTMIENTTNPTGVWVHQQLAH